MLQVEQPASLKSFLVATLLASFLLLALTPAPASADGDADAYASMLDAQGRVVSIGEVVVSQTGSSDFGIARYDTSNALDLSFGTGGRSQLDFSIGSEGNDKARAGAISEKRLIAIGNRNGTVGTTSSQDFALAAFSEDGKVAGGFGTNGTVTTDFTGGLDYAEAATVDSQQRIIVAGTTDGDVALARYLPNGDLDPSLDTDGKVRTPVGYYGTDQAYAVRMDGDKIVVAGRSNDAGQQTDFLVVRYNSDGSLDTTFDNDGTLRIDVLPGKNDIAEALLVQPDGKYLIAGYTTGTNRDFALLRLNQNGSLDDGSVADPTPLDRFGLVGAGGKAILDYGAGSDSARALDLDPVNGSILVGGYAYESTTVNAAAIARYTSDGTLDNGFGINGKSKGSSSCYGSTFSASIDAFARRPNGTVQAIGGARGSSCALGFLSAPVSPTSGLPTTLTGNAFTGVPRQSSSTLLPPEAPVLLEPADNTLRGSGAIPFSWRASRHVRTYDLYVDDVLKSGANGITATAFTVTGLQPGAHTWKVVAKNAQADTNSAIGNFVLSEERAQKFRPILRFDSQEKWRPLNVERFFSEGARFAGQGHQVCEDVNNAPDTCAPLNQWEGLRSFNTSDSDLSRAYLNIRKTTDTATGETKYTSPDDATSDGTPDCLNDAPGVSAEARLYDCDSGPDSGSYFNYTPASAGSPYEYFDYWFFYRFNEFETITNYANHEGEWENVSLAANPATPDTFDYATFFGHRRGPWRYLRSTLSCQGSANQTPTTCGNEQAKTGQRVNIYIADGSHAAYPQACDNALLPCVQTDETDGSYSLIPENRFDGLDYWGGNDTPSSLIPFPKTTSSNYGWNLSLDRSGAVWTDWPGAWGMQLGPEAPRAPGSPGTRSTFNSPQNDDHCTERYSSPADECATPEFEISPTNRVVGEPVTFQSTTTGPVALQRWDTDNTNGLNDTDSTSTSATRTFSTSGEKTVRLEVTDQSGYSEWVDKTFYVAIASGISAPGASTPETQSVAATASSPTLEDGALLTSSAKTAQSFAETSPNTSYCNSWAGPGVQASVCDERLLQRALKRGELGEAGEVGLSALSTSSRAASAPGIAQVVGKPLTVGDSVAIEGNISDEAKIVVKAANSKESVIATFDSAQITDSNNARIIVKEASDGAPFVRVREKSGSIVPPTVVKRDKHE